MASADFISPSPMGMGMGDISFIPGIDADIDIDLGIEPFKTSSLDDILSMNPFESSFDLGSCSPGSTTTGFDRPQMTFAPPPPAASYQLPDLPGTTDDDQQQLWSMIHMDDASDHLSWDTPSLQQDSGTNDDENTTSPSIQASTPISGSSNSPRDVESRSASISHIQIQMADNGLPLQHPSPQQSSLDPKTEPRKRGRKKKLPRSDGEKEVIRSRFLERNRLAASKCREKKKKWVDDLENRRVQIEMENSRLRKLQDELLAVIGLLREELVRHDSCGHEEIERFAKKLQPRAAEAGWTPGVEDLVLGKTNSLEMAIDNHEDVLEASSET